MRRTHLRGHTNILKRLLIHVGGFTLGLIMRHLTGFGTPRGLQGRVAPVIAALLIVVADVRERVSAISESVRMITDRRRSLGYF
jgi:transposase